MPSVTALDREQTNLGGQRLHVAESSRHKISELAYELLQKRLDERRATNERTNLAERARVENEHSLNLIELAAAHEKETAGFKDTEFAMIAEFDAERDNLSSTKLLANKLAVESQKHVELLDSLQAKLASDDQAAERELQKVLDAYEKATCKKLNCLNCAYAYKGPDIVETRRKTEQSAIERHNSYDNIVERHTAAWTLRQEALRLEPDTRASRQIRIDLEHDFQVRFAECDQKWATIQRRQTEELEELEVNRDLALTAVQGHHECVQAELYEERCRVEEWWKHLCDETVAARKRIDQDEKSAAAELDRDEDGGTSAEVTRATKMVTRAAAYCHEVAEEVETLEFVPPNVEKKAAAAYHTPGEDQSEAGLPVIIIPLAPVGDTGNPAGSSLSGASRGLPSQPSVLSVNMAPLPDESSLMPVTSANIELQYDLAGDGVWRPGAERYATLANPFADAERQIVVVSQLAHSEPGGSIPDRSGSPDSGGSDSDFVEM